MAIKTILEAKNLTKSFGSKTVVDNISFQIGEGEIVGLLGPNGAGKTTTIQMLLGTLMPTRGTIKYFGKELNSYREEILQQVNFCSSYIRLPWRLTVWENLDVVARLYGVKNHRNRIYKLLTLFEMLKYKDRPMSALSAGQVMRVVLVKAFLNYPRVLLLDEPTASLDPDVAQKIRDFLILQQKQFKTTMLITSHNMVEVEQLCDRVIFLSRGKILAEDTPENLAKEINICRVELLIDKDKSGAAEVIAENSWEVGIDGKYLKIELKEDEISKLLSVLANSGINYQEISIDKPDLEDYFIKVANIGKEKA